MDEYGHFSPFNDDINYTTMNSNALISIFHQRSHDYAHTKMTGIMIINRVEQIQKSLIKLSELIDETLVSADIYDILMRWSSLANKKVFVVKKGGLYRTNLSCENVAQYVYGDFP